MMQTVVVSRPTINMGALDEQLRAVLGSDCIGISTGQGVVTVYLADHASDSQRQYAEKLVREHDPSQLTQAQAKALQREADLQKLRQDSTDALQEGETLTLEQVVKRLVWLEAEVRNLRGL